MKRVLSGIVLGCLLVLLTPLATRAQAALGARAGAAAGSTTFLVGELNGRVGLFGPLELAAGVQRVASPATCEQVHPEFIRCNYGGWGVHAGPAMVLLDNGRFRAAAGAAVGRFFRANNSNTWSVGTDAEMRFRDKLSLQGGLHHRRIRDALFREHFGEDARFTSLTAGLMFSVR
jgi:hypothetical protein